MSSAYCALFTTVSPIPAGLVADFAAPCICEHTLYCNKHKCGNLDTWYDCPDCLESEVSEPLDDRYELRPLCYHLSFMEDYDAREILEIDSCCNCNPRNHRCGFENYVSHRCKNIRAIATACRQ